ncbi:MAG: hypothetical protein KGL43_16120 [Burkholderiales bacterium]|nr:hypothetical protein [Burkholderiales bacterium]MDE2455119.1 hypothetical protein [Burkholderiales bacterium]
MQGRAAPTLADEQRRLAALFQGTPVLFALNADGSLRVEVPLRFCFDPGRAVVKPPLAAVLDRLARSQRDATTRFALTAPLDRGSRDAALAPARSDSVQRYLVERGIAASRFLPAGQTISGWIRIVVAV